MRFPYLRNVKKTAYRGRDLAKKLVHYSWTTLNCITVVIAAGSPMASFDTETDLEHIIIIFGVIIDVCNLIPPQLTAVMRCRLVRINACGFETLRQAPQ